VPNYLPEEPRGWKRPFEEPIPLPQGRQLITLEDAGNYIVAPPKKQADAVEWQAAMECLILVAEKNGYCSRPQVALGYGRVWGATMRTREMTPL
jgi:hypothetical protein